jgi:hypothetical protein
MDVGFGPYRKSVGFNLFKLTLPLSHAYWSVDIARDIATVSTL